MYSQRVVNKAGKIGYYPQCKNFWVPGCRRRPEFNHAEKRKVQHVWIVRCKSGKQSHQTPLLTILLER